ncbi:MAG: hypothetical protein ACREUY_07495, partial [Burkholderiales bacterium]
QGVDAFDLIKLWLDSKLQRRIGRDGAACEKGQECGVYASRYTHVRSMPAKKIQCANFAQGRLQLVMKSDEMPGNRQRMSYAHLNNEKNPNAVAKASE